MAWKPRIALTSPRMHSENPPSTPVFHLPAARPDLTGAPDPHFPFPFRPEIKIPFLAERIRSFPDGRFLLPMAPDKYVNRAGH